MTVQMTITATCTVNSATTLNFGTQGVLSTNVDQTSVPPGYVGRFTFGLHAESPPGGYDESFNVLSNSLRWFDWSRLGSFHVPITVITNTRFDDP